MAQVETCSHRQGNQGLYNQGRLLEIPIAPLENKFDIGFLWRGRRDHHGSHTENFDKKVWKNERVQAALQEILQAMVLLGPGALPALLVFRSSAGAISPGQVPRAGGSPSATKCPSQNN
jgi:hypothetical protein